ncbi:hypothetical protein CPB84DRAFT_1840809 [Gymnopilus junonius]|uniref:Uncharacterized protein n=1 Tax=Gymnopilus junonius TaxID=109634 RepID=A0A9P5TUC7_GYMJU|nr:hypothetical protein CPB84DRAFT_1840809 [Gymnopilus junonius]
MSPLSRTVLSPRNGPSASTLRCSTLFCDATSCLSTQHLPVGLDLLLPSFLKIVTDHDVRQPDILSAVENSRSQYPLTDLSDDMEVHLVQTHKAHCVASYNFEEVRDDNALCLAQKDVSSTVLELSVESSGSRINSLESYRRCVRRLDLVLYNLISGQKSTVPFSKVECEELSRVVRDLALPRNTNSISKTVFLAWFLREVCSYRDAENWGQYTHKESHAVKTQKLASNQPTFNPTPFIRFIVDFVVNVLFFGIPHTYRAHVKVTSEYRGRLSNVQRNWQGYVERLVREYSHFLLISTVLLSATVGFLSVPNIPEGAQVAAYISTFASLGSIIVGVFSIWRHQANTTTADSFTYMHNVQHNYFGFYGHAVLLSLPPTLLVWAILTFAISILVSILHNPNGAAWAKISTWSVLAIFIILFLAVILALYTFSIIWRFERRTAVIWHRVSTLLSHSKFRANTSAT